MLRADVADLRAVLRVDAIDVFGQLPNGVELAVAKGHELGFIRDRELPQQLAGGAVDEHLRQEHLLLQVLALHVCGAVGSITTDLAVTPRGMCVLTDIRRGAAAAAVATNAYTPTAKPNPNNLMFMARILLLSSESGGSPAAD